MLTRIFISLKKKRIFISFQKKKRIFIILFLSPTLRLSFQKNKEFSLSCSLVRHCTKRFTKLVQLSLI